MTALAPLFIIIPLACGFAIPAISRFKGFRWVPDALAMCAFACLLAMGIAQFGAQRIIPMGSYPAPFGIELRIDGLSSLMLLMANTMGFFAALYAVPYMKQYTSKTRFFSLFLMQIAGINGAVLTGDLFSFYLFLELASFAAYALVAFGCEAEELEASFKYLVFGTVSSVFILIGIGIVYMMTGTLSLTHLAAYFASSSAISYPLLVAIVLFLTGLGIKAALFPFHAWLPDAHTAAPAPVSAMLSGVVIKTLGVYALARILFNVVGVNAEILSVLKWFGTAAMIVGMSVGVGQWDFKRLCAYSSVTQVGYIFLGLGLGTPLGIAGAMYHLINHSAYKSLLFMNAGSVEYSTGTRDIRNLGGLYKPMPVTAGTSLIASMSISGLPPFSGFWSKLIIIIACVASGDYLFGIIAASMSIVTLAAFLKVQKAVFFDSLRLAVENIKKTPVLMNCSMIALAVISIAMAALILGGFEQPYLVNDAARVLLNGRLGM